MKDSQQQDTFAPVQEDHDLPAGAVTDKETAQRQALTNELMNGLIRAMEHHEFKLYLQPKFSLADLTVIGAGYSLLNSVVDIPINTVKLDRSFLTRCTTNQRGLYFLQEIVNMVKGLGYQVICEGIETKDQVDLMRSLGCDAAQGFWFSKAISTEAFEQKYMTDRH